MKRLALKMAALALLTTGTAIGTPVAGMSDPPPVEDPAVPTEDAGSDR